MNKKSFIAVLALVLVGSSVVADRAGEAINAADQAVQEARASIEKGKELVVQIPEGSAFLPEVLRTLEAASGTWDLAVGSLDGAKGVAGRISSVAKEEVAADYTSLVVANAAIAQSGANLVKICIIYVDAVANNKTEALGTIQTALQGAAEAASNIQSAYEQMKVSIAAKYSK